MGPLVIVFFLIFLSGTTMSNESRKRCNSLKYQDIGWLQINSTFSYKHFAFFDKEPIYVYENSNQRAQPFPKWKNANNWDEESLYQKLREDFFKENFQEIISNSDDIKSLHSFQGNYGCELCKNGTISGYWYYKFDNQPFIKFDLSKCTWIPEVPEAYKIKEKWEEDPGAVNRAKDYLEKDCIDQLKKYQNYQN